MAEEKNTDEIEKGIAEALKPFAPGFIQHERPKVVPVLETAETGGTGRQWLEDAQKQQEPFQPQRTLVTHLTDIENVAIATSARVQNQDKHLAEILGAINQRLGLILDRIGVVENLIGVK